MLSSSIVCFNCNIQATVDGCNIEGNGVVNDFDLGINLTGYGSGGGIGRLTNTKKVRFVLSGISLTPETLLGTVHVNAYKDCVNAAAKVQSISSGGSDIVGDPLTNGTPVPGPLPLLGAG